MIVVLLVNQLEFLYIDANALAMHCHSQNRSQKNLPMHVYKHCKIKLEKECDKNHLCRMKYLLLLVRYLFRNWGKCL